MKNKYIWVAGALFLVTVGLWFVKDQIVAKNPFPIHSVDVVKAWDFPGIYKDAGEREARAISEISRLKGLLGKGEYTDYTLYVSIAAQYELLGDGKRDYEYLGKALILDSEKTGLAWHNMGKLMEKLGAYESARIAFGRAIKAEAAPVYYLSQISFLEQYFPTDTATIKEARTAAGLPPKNLSSDE
ncbi:MAG: hypothetical protein UY07_C0032G0002 [Parcubacteria group bacterium GW2011_GWA1_47_8]|nr:MAG: hypothetical protein UY07_C0032G0002 [Parcubacteria group bacterium GW2011_GWA1_47_8]KKW07997.1 MAG: hypothetical protein UY42_C0002G0046 [Parcubacteria group bacterium GW2011_GWA2_49_16]